MLVFASDEFCFFILNSYLKIFRYGQLWYINGLYNLYAHIFGIHFGGIPTFRRKTTAV